MECVSCTRGLDHCHGTLVVHPTELVECSDIQCVDLDQARHLAVVDCHEVLGGCECLGSEPVEQPRLARLA